MPMVQSWTSTNVLSHLGNVQAARAALKQGAFLRALLITLRLKDAALLRDVILSTPPDDVRHPLNHMPGCAPSAMLSVLALTGAAQASQGTDRQGVLTARADDSGIRDEQCAACSVFCRDPRHPGG